MKLISVILLFILTSNLYSVDDGDYEVEYSFGEIFVYNSYKDSNNEKFIYLAHNYLLYNGSFYLSFKSQLGVSKDLLFQNSGGLSYKNIITGVIPGVKYKYLNGFWGIIPEVSSGITLDILSLWNPNNENILIFLTGINLGIGASYEFENIRIGLKLMYNVNYGNFMNKQESRFLSQIFTIMLSFDFYEND